MDGTRADVNGLFHCLFYLSIHWKKAMFTIALAKLDTAPPTSVVNITACGAGPKFRSTCFTVAMATANELSPNPMNPPAVVAAS